MGLFWRNQATHEILRKEGSRSTPFLTRGSCEFSSSFYPSFSPSPGKRKAMVLAGESFSFGCLGFEGQQGEGFLAKRKSESMLQRC